MYYKKTIIYKDSLEIGYFFAGLHNLKEKIIENITAQLSKTYNPNIGYFLKITDLRKIISINTSDINYDTYVYQVEIDILTFKPMLDELVIGVIDEIDQNGNIIFNIGLCSAYIHNIQYPAEYTYSHKTNSLYSTQSKRTLKAGDYIKAKLIEIRTTVFNEPRLRFSLKPNYGKVVWDAKSHV